MSSSRTDEAGHGPGFDGAVTDALVPPPGCPAHAGADASAGSPAAAASGPAASVAFVGPGDVVRLNSLEHQSDPMGVYERLRTRYGPVAPVLVEGDLPAWLVLGYRENLEVARTPNRFSRDSRNWGSVQRGEVPEDSPLLPMLGWQPLVVFLDGEEHQRLRKAVTDSLNQLDRRGVRRHVTRFANQLIDEFCAKGEADLVGQFAEQLPMLVMTQLFGMPDEYGPRLTAAVLDLVRGTDTAFESNEFVVETLRQLVPRKRREPGFDIGSWLMEHPAELSDEEVVQHLRVLLAAANENTTVCISNTLRLVLSDPRFRASLAGARMTLPDAVEQVLWDEPSTMVCPARWAVGDTQLGDANIRAGDMLLLGLAAGNVDPEIRPDLSAPMLGNRSHLAFSGGPHECPGQDIGRAITEAAVDVLLTRLPDIQVAVPEDELVSVSTWLSRHLTALPVEFTPQPPSARSAEPAPSAVPDGRTAYPVNPSANHAAPPVGTLAGPPPAAPAEYPGTAAPVQAPAPPQRRPSLWRRLFGRGRSSR
ncbi:cytochrome P450 [Yinghuangia sp. YIM S09857]|uniref:cytochrome P450 n=1 Tax=Yinghuangia sp. YIM S09857 TaxID=3436929 RepID=UPI003F52C555